MSEGSTVQRITRLSALGDVVDLIERSVRAAAPDRAPLAAALGRVLAEDVTVATLPPRAIALRDGFAVDAAAIADAGPYSPAPMPVDAHSVETGGPLPDGTDAVVPVDAVRQGGRYAEALVAVAPGEGVLAAGGDATPQNPLRRRGDRLRDIDIAVLAAAGVAQVLSCQPRVRIICGTGKRTPMIEAGLAFLARSLAQSGVLACGPQSGTVEDGLRQSDHDAIFVLGGTGAGRQDASVRTLARLGTVAVHGVAMSPGETAGLGFINDKPVLLIPGRLDATVAVWLFLGRPVVARLAGGKIAELVSVLPLKRKVTSTIGLTELVPVSCTGGVAEPLATGYLSLTALATADGWIVIPAESEGFAAGTPVAVRPWS